MSSVKPVTSSSFETTASERLSAYLQKARGMTDGMIIPLTPDASTREYFRVPWERGTAIAAVYPEAFDPEVHPYLDVTRLFLDCALPVPEVYEAVGANGIIVQEDLGDNQLCRVFETASDEDCEGLLEQAIEIIARIQAATPRAFERKSIAS